MSEQRSHPVAQAICRAGLVAPSGQSSVSRTAWFGPQQMGHTGHEVHFMAHTKKQIQSHIQLLSIKSSLALWEVWPQMTSIMEYILQSTWLQSPTGLQSYPVLGYSLWPVWFQCTIWGPIQPQSSACTLPAPCLNMQYSYRHHLVGK